MLTFPPREPLVERSPPQMRERDQLVQQRNTSSINVVSLLQKLQTELLESIPAHRRTTLTGRQKQQLALSARKLVQKRLDLHPQFEEIEGSQERSPYVVRHMQVQRQNWIRIEDSKPHFGLHQRPMSSASVGVGGGLVGPGLSARMPGEAPAASSARLVVPGTQMSELGKKSIEDTDVNLTNTSVAIGGDTSSHVIQRPLPVNRIQQKITKDRTYGLE